MAVEVDESDGVAVGRIDHGQTIVHDVPAYAQRVLETNRIARLGVRDVDLPVPRIHRHVEQGSPQALDLLHVQGRDVDDEEVIVAQGVGQTVAPVLADLVPPLSGPGVPLDDQTDLGYVIGRIVERFAPRDALRQRGVGRRSSVAVDVAQAEGVEAGGIQVQAGRAREGVLDAQNGRLVSRPQHDGVDLRPVVGHG